MIELQPPTLAPEVWLNYRTAAVRQLAFALASPNILSSLPPELQIQHAFTLHADIFWQQHYLNYQQRLAYLDLHPEALHNFLNQLKSTRLGLRFEMLMWFWLLDRNYHPFELLGHSIQIIDGAKTVGELDFLLHNQDTQQVEHWEVALKYYLAEADFSLPHWYGLNRSDTLARKLNHFSQKQFQFEQALNFPIQQRFAVLKGQLYFPHLYSQNTVDRMPHWVNRARRLGTWGNHIPEKTADFYRLQRHEWICPNAQASSLTNQWWTDGLYFQATTSEFYMYRAASYLSYPPLHVE
ncbi:MULTISPECIES: DUF1853 family protein [Acinetobacter]|uniref:DUF1853 family protein n=1 Tax=Acinetobacter TaxID=469 RepID=UPI001443C95F|nr:MULTISPECIES: DUF1853 family protein [Acinetobacter]